jgi:GT2 family glycosyltransferase
MSLTTKRNRQLLVSIIIVNWDGLEHLQKCLPTIYRQDYKSIEVILVDNGSKDDSVEWVKRHFPQVKLLIEKKNLGFAEGNNVGFKQAKGEYILFLNNDTQVTDHFLSELIKSMMKDKALGGVQSKILFMDSPSQLDSAGSYLTNTGFLYHSGVYEKDSVKFNTPKLIFSAKGACMCFRKDVLDKVVVSGELFDNDFFAYFEETDLCHRVWLAGYKIKYIPASIIYHKFGATSVKLRKPFVEFHSYKNRINSYIKNFDLTNLAKILSLHLLLCFALSLAFLLKGEFGIAIAIHKAIWWNILNLNSTLRKRSKVQHKIRKVKDGIILREIMVNPRIVYYLAQLGGWNVRQIYEYNAKN